jgi:hypothetical protein
VSEHHFYSRCIPDGRRFVRVGLRQFNPHLPNATLVKTCRKEPGWLTAKWTHHMPWNFLIKLKYVSALKEKLQAFSFFVHLALSPSTELKCMLMHRHLDPLALECWWSWTADRNRH